jgi:FtsP/CotA-like multicopper oxidase with cupredoxin domain
LEPQLRSIAEVPDNPVARTDYVMLTGGGSDYQWGFNGKAMMHETLLTVRQGERYEIVMHNMTGMAHPMHLHGHYFKVVGIDGQRFNGALRDTVLVPIGAQVAIQFDADNPGTWAFHCHHLYHMNSGMMAALAYSSAA